MSEVKSNKKDLSKKDKDRKLDDKKVLDKNLKKSDGKSKILNSTHIQKMNSKDSKNSAINEKSKHKENEKANLTARDKIDINKNTSSDNKSFSDNDISEYDDQWRNLNELVIIYFNN